MQHASAIGVLLFWEMACSMFAWPPRYCRLAAPRMALILPAYETGYAHTRPSIDTPHPGVHDETSKVLRLTAQIRMGPQKSNHIKMRRTKLATFASGRILRLVMHGKCALHAFEIDFVLLHT